MNEGNSNKLNGHFNVDESYENDNWIKTSIRTFAFGNNRNNSNINKSSMSEFGNAQKTIGGIPIVAKYNDEKDDLEGHNVELRQTKDGEYEFYHDTTPLGFTSPSATFFTEEVNEGTDINPNYKTYITVNDVYLWKRFDATKKILNWQKEGISTKVSMEIDKVEGSFNSDGYFGINDFIFTAITALGSDVEPCFSRAEIQLYAVNDFKEDLKKLMFELTAHNNDVSKGGNENLEKKKRQSEEIETQVEEVLESQLATHVEETEEVETTTVSEEVENQVEEEVVTEPETVEEVTEEVDTIEDVTDEVSEDFTEKTTEVEETVEQTVKEKVFEETQVETEVVEEVVETVNEFEIKFNDLSEQYTSLQAELEDLRAFKRNTLEKELSEKFESQLDSKEISDAFENSKGKSIEEIQIELFALVGKKNFSMQKEQTKEVKIAVSVETASQKPKDPYDGFFEKYLDKK